MDFATFVDWVFTTAWQMALWVTIAVAVLAFAGLAGVGVGALSDAVRWLIREARTGSGGP